ncbi:MAG TPA: EAL domain-containing protein [Nocardioides sp.]|nr:EAL domain-containing protein [Nocardioides sp.]
MQWRSSGTAALGGCMLFAALPYPDARTAVLLATLLVAAAVVAGRRAFSTESRRVVLLLGLGVVLHVTTTALRQAELLPGAGRGATLLGVAHAGSFALSAVCLLVLVVRAVGGDRRDRPTVTDLDAELRKAVAEGQLCVHYQPIVNAGTGQAASVEALVRWQHPTRGLLAPAAFLPAAERAGLMVEIGRQVLTVACADLATWRRRHPELADLALAVNVSERELLHDGFAEHVTHTLRRHGLPAGALHLELTETVAVNEETIAAVLEPLASSGVALSIDDFGTGHSTLHRLNRLRELQVQRLKIDKSFVDEIDAAGQGGGPLLASIIALAHSVGHSVVAEGVETSEQAAFLARHGCDELQGYLYSRPVPADQVTALLPGLRAVVPQQIRV